MFKIFRNNCCGLDVHKTWIYACIVKESKVLSTSQALNLLRQRGYVIKDDPEAA